MRGRWIGLAALMFVLIVVAPASGALRLSKDRAERVAEIGARHVWLKTDFVYYYVNGCKRRSRMRVDCATVFLTAKVHCDVALKVHLTGDDRAVWGIGRYRCHALP